MNMLNSLLSLEQSVDHLLLGVPNLEEGIAWVEEKTGVQAILGGRHPGIGTHNALLSLGAKQYLEIIAPDPTQTTIAPHFAFVQLATEPRLLTWAAATTNIEEIAAKAKLAGFALNGPNAGSRTRPDGRTLSWKTLFLQHGLGLRIPFFIEWDNASLHPSEDSPSGCSLRSFIMESSQPTELRVMLKQLGIDADISYGDEPRMKVVLDTPKGIVAFDS